MQTTWTTLTAVEQNVFSQILNGHGALPGQALRGLVTRGLVHAGRLTLAGHALAAIVFTDDRETE